MIDKLNILVIGGGSIGERHVRCFQSTGQANVWLCEIQDDLRQRLESTYQLEKTFDTLEDGIAADPDAAVIATPAHLHVPMGIQLAKANISILMEKPLSTSLLGISDLREAVSAGNVAFGMAYVYRCHPVLEDFRSKISSNKYGRPLQLVVTAGQHFPFYRPAYRDIYYAKREQGGGAIQDALTHLLNAGEWLFGPITKVVADAEHCLLDGVEVEDTVQVLARHGKLLASYCLNQHQFANEVTFTVACERATLRLEMHSNCWKLMEAPDSDWKIKEFPKLERDQLFVRQAQAFLDCLQNSNAPLCSLAEGIQTLNVNLAILRSLDSAIWEPVT